MDILYLLLTCESVISLASGSRLVRWSSDDDGDDDDYADDEYDGLVERDLIDGGWRRHEWRTIDVFIRSIDMFRRCRISRSMGYFVCVFMFRLYRRVWELGRGEIRKFVKTKQRRNVVSI